MRSLEESWKVVFRRFHRHQGQEESIWDLWEKTHLN